MDRDYRCPEEIRQLIEETRGTVPHFHILSGKEIENYLLVPAAITRAINDRLKERRSKIPSVSVDVVNLLLSEISSESKSSILSQHVSNRLRYFDKRTAKDPATVVNEAIGLLDQEWQTQAKRLMVMPGKQVLADLNSKLQKNYGVSITALQIIRQMEAEEIAADLKTILQDLNDFTRGLQAPRVSRSVA